MIDQEKIHKQCISEYPEERIKGLEQFRYKFSLLPDKQQAWNDLYILTNDNNNNVKSMATSTFGSVFYHASDKHYAWNNLRRLTNDKDIFVRSRAAAALASAFPYLPDKQEAWNELHRLIKDKNTNVKLSAISTLGSVFSYAPDKQKAWKELHRLTIDKNSFVRSRAVNSFDFVFSQVPDKQEAWMDLHRLINNEDRSVKYKVVSTLGSIFSQIPDKQEAWNDLHKLINDADWDVRFRAAYALSYAYCHVPDKEEVWIDLHKLISDENDSVRLEATSTLGSVFSHIQDKQKAWKDLSRLTTDKDISVRSRAASALGFAFFHAPDKQEAWDNLHKLINDKDWDVRSGAASALGFSFPQVPKKQEAWNDLHRMTSDQSNSVRYRVANVLGSVFSQVPDKQQAWNDLIKLTNDKGNLVRTSAFHSLGKISIFNASQAEKDEDYKEELEKAITFFEKAAQESEYGNPSQFCLPFYRSFHTIIFQRQGKAKEEVDNYLSEAKYAVRGSKSKELLLEAVENLSNALIEVQNLENMDLQTMKGELNFYRKYCENAAELMIYTEETAPFATIAIKKGLPILDRNLKELLEEIQNKAKIACRESKDTVTQEIACTVNSEIQKMQISDLLELEQFLEDIAYSLKRKIIDIPENEHLLNKIELMKNEKNTGVKLRILSFVIENLPTIRVVSEKELDQKLDQKLPKFDLIFGEIVYIKDKLSCLSFDISKIKLNSADLLLDLKAMKEELERLSKIEGLNTLSIEKLDSVQFEKLNGLNNDILERLDEIKILIFELSKDNDELYQEYSRRLDKLKQSKLDTLLQRYSAAISLISFVISGIQIAR